MLDERQEKEAQAAQDGVDRAIRNAFRGLGLAADRAAAYTTWADLPLYVRLPRSAEEERGIKAVEAIRDRANDWRTRMLGWARANRKPDGSQYAFEAWKGFGAELEQAAKDQATYADDTGAVAGARAAARTVVAPFVAAAAAVQDVAAASDAFTAAKSRWPWYAAGAGALLAAAGGYWLLTRGAAKAVKKVVAEVAEATA